jgi:adenylosuccinate lyase
VSKRDKLLKSLQVQSSKLIEEISSKEDQEKDIACFGNSHFINSSFTNVKSEMKSDVSKLKREVQVMKASLEQMIRVFRGKEIMVDQ